MASLSTGLVIVHGNRMEDLREVMLSWLQSHPLPPLTPEVILVQSNGMKQWLVQSMAQHLGISAGVELYLPSEFVWRAYRQVLGNQQVPKQMAFDKAPLTWRIYRLLDWVLTCNDTAYQPLQHYLAVTEQQDERRFQLATQIADLYDQYQTYRADWISDWSKGLDQIINQQGSATPLNEQSWQAALWRDLQQDISQLGQSQTSRASIHAQFMQKMQESDAQSNLKLPERIIVFGVSSLPQQTLEALSMMAKASQVLLFVNNPCQYYWGDVQDARYWRRNQLLKAHRHAIKHDLPLSPLQEDYASFHPLLAAWGKQGKDYLQLLNDIDETSIYAHWFQRVDVFVEPKESTQLAELQRHILQLTPPPEQPQPVDADDSICLRSGYSSQREVEMLHDHLLALFDANPNLAPSDIMVMVPDIDQFAAAVSAVFGRMSPKDKCYIPYSIADTSLRIEPMMQLLQWLLTLPTAEIGLSDWHAMFELEAVRARFKLDEHDVERLHHWLSDAGVRWGLDAQDRKKRHNLPAGVMANSWLFGLERLLLGYAMGESHQAWQSVLPVAAVSGSSAELLGALAEWIQSIRIAQQLLAHEITPVIWRCYLEELLTLFFDDQQDLNSQRWLSRFRQGLTNWLSACEMAGFQQKLPLSLVAKAWLDNIDDNSSLQRPFLTGGVQFATLMPMRAIPFKVICLIGLNESDYPRQQVKQDFDLMALTGQWRAGDRSRRYDDRYLFLEAILSARQQLYLSWTGRSIRDDQPRAPSILVSQFIDYCHQLWTPKLVPQQHPLQPFSKTYLQPDSHLKTYAADWLSLLDNSTTCQHDWSQAVLAESSIPNNLPITRLIDLLRHPQRVIIGHRLGVKFNQPQEVLSDDEIFELSGLESYQLYQQQIDTWLTTGHEKSLPLELSGALPLAGFAQVNQQQLQQHSEQLWQRWQTLVSQYPNRLAPLPLALTLSGTHLHGQIDLLYSNQHQQQSAIYFIAGFLGDSKKLKAYKLIAAWLNHCLAHAAHQVMTSHIVAMDTQVSFQPIEANQARLWLQNYMDLYQQAWHQPLKVGCKSGIAYVLMLQQLQANPKNAEMDAEILNTKALDAARNEFDGGFGRAGEREQSLELQRCFQSFDELQPEFCDQAQRLYGVMLERIVIL